MAAFVTSRRRLLRMAADILAVLVGLACIALILWVFRYNDRLYPNTYIEGIDCSGMRAEEAAAALTAAASGKSLTLVDDRGAEIGSVPLCQIMPDAEEMTQSVRNIIAAQRGAPDINAMRGSTRRDFGLDWPLADELVPAALAMAGGWIGAEAVDARIEKVGEHYEIIPAEYGTAADISACAEAVSERLTGGNILTEDTIRVGLRTVGLNPEVGSRDEQLLGILGEIEALTDREVRLDFGDGIVYTLTQDDILRAYDITITDSGISARLNRESVNTLFEAVMDRVPADGIERKYSIMQRGELTHYNDWDTGYILDRDAMASKLWAQLVIGESGTVYADYDYTSSCDARFAVGDWFIEVSIENQFMWLYKDGKPIVATPVVTGSVAKRNDTPTGVYRVSYTQKNTWLYGSGYSSHVDYWVPFFGNYGIHDSWWMEEYGGDIYLTDGSHGCVNTPLEAMALIYENCEKGTPVIVY